MIDSEIEMKALAEVPRNTHKKRSLIRKSQVCQRRLAVLHLFLPEPNSSNLSQRSTKLKTNSINSISINTNLDQLLFDQIQ